VAGFSGKMTNTGIVKKSGSESPFTYGNHSGVSFHPTDDHQMMLLANDWQEMLNTINILRSFSKIMLLEGRKLKVVLNQLPGAGILIFIILFRKMLLKILNLEIFKMHVSLQFVYNFVVARSNIIRFFILVVY
jgi:hypothetical protein